MGSCSVFCQISHKKSEKFACVFARHVLQHDTTVVLAHCLLKNYGDSYV